MVCHEQLSNGAGFTTSRVHIIQGELGTVCRDIEIDIDIPNQWQQNCIQQFNRYTNSSLVNNTIAGSETSDTSRKNK